MSKFWQLLDRMELHSHHGDLKMKPVSWQSISFIQDVHVRIVCYPPLSLFLCCPSPSPNFNYLMSDTCVFFCALIFRFLSKGKCNYQVCLPNHPQITTKQTSKQQHVFEYTRCHHFASTNTCLKFIMETITS